MCICEIENRDIAEIQTETIKMILDKRILLIVIETGESSRNNTRNSFDKITLIRI